MIKIEPLFSGSKAYSLLSHLSVFTLSYFYLFYFYPCYSTSLFYNIIHTAKCIQCDIKSLNIHIFFKVSTELDFSFDNFFIFELYEIL